MGSRTGQGAMESTTAKRSIFKDLQRESLVQLHPRRTEQRSHRFGRPPLPPDHLSQILGMHPQLQHGDLRPLDGLYLYVLGMVHEGPGDGFNQLLHQAPPRELFSARTWEMRSPSGAEGGRVKLARQEGN